MNHIKTRTKEQILDDWIGVKDAHKRTEYKWILSAMDDWGTEVAKNLHKNHINDVEDVFSITGRGTVATGRIETGVINVGNEVDLK